MNKFLHQGFVPDWFKWRINGVDLINVSDVIKNNNTIDSFEFVPLKTMSFRQVGTLREEMFNTAKNIVMKAAGRTISVAVSGIDSEIIARLINEAGGNVELLYLKFWFKDNTETDVVKKIAKDLNVPYYIYDFNWAQHGHSVMESLNITCIPATMMNHFYWLFSNRPKNNFFVTGHGTFRKAGGRFKYMANKYNLIDKIKSRGRAFPFELRDTCLRTMGNHYGLSGEYYFHVSSLSEVVAYFKSPYIEYNYDTFEIEDKMVYTKEFPECIFNKKTGPFTNSNRENRILNYFDRYLEKKYQGWEFFKTRTISDYIFVDELFS